MANNLAIFFLFILYIFNIDNNPNNQKGVTICGVFGYLHFDWIGFIELKD